MVISAPSVSNQNLGYHLLDIAPPREGPADLYLEGDPEECNICHEVKEIYRHDERHSVFCTACKAAFLAAQRIGLLPKCPVCRVEIGSIEGVPINPPAPLANRAVVAAPPAGDLSMSLLSLGSDMRRLAARVFLVSGLVFVGVGGYEEISALAIAGFAVIGLGVLVKGYNTYLSWPRT